jgi:hypothetical protein
MESITLLFPLPFGPTVVEKSNQNVTYSSCYFTAVLRIHDILGWIRIRGSMPLTNGSESCYFRHWPSRCQQKSNFLTHFFCLNIKSKKESQNSRNQGLSYYFCNDTRYLWQVDPDPGGPKTWGSGGSGFGSATLLHRFILISLLCWYDPRNCASV